MKRKKIPLLAAAAALIVSVLPIYAQDYSNEEEWYTRCTKVQTSQEGVDACVGFQEYQKEKKESLQNSIAAFQGNIDSLSEDVSNMEALALEQKNMADALQADIAVQEAAIAQYESSIAATQAEIEQKQIQIDAWDGQIKDRMKKEQAATSTNSYIDLIMGSKGLADMLRRISGLERITQSDQNQIETLEKMKQELEFSKGELERLQAQEMEQKQILEDQKAQAQALEESYNQLKAQYEAQKASLEAQMRSAQASMDAIKEFVISADLGSGIDYSSIPSVSGFVNPVPAGSKSAGTWAYPGGGMHLGVDLAAPIGTPLIAPASGLIVSASATQPSNSGYLGNWSGFPYGSGNFIAMLCEVNGTLYAVSFSHLSNTLYVSPGQTVAQGQTIALTGNSGNSSGPHTHVEIYNLGKRSMSEMVSYLQSTGDVSFGAGWGSVGTACEATGSAPCRERPESFF